MLAGAAGCAADPSVEAVEDVDGDGPLVEEALLELAEPSCAVLPGADDALAEEVALSLCELLLVLAGAADPSVELVDEDGLVDEGVVLEFSELPLVFAGGEDEAGVPPGVDDVFVGELAEPLCAVLPCEPPPALADGVDDVEVDDVPVVLDGE